jgi:hypothetical protein
MTIRMKEGLRAMQAACRMFLDENQSPRSGYGPPYEAQFHSTPGELRALLASTSLGLPAHTTWKWMHI